MTKERKLESVIEEEASELETPASELCQAEKRQKQEVKSIPPNQTSVFSSRRASESHAPPLEEKSNVAFDTDEEATPIPTKPRVIRTTVGEEQ